MTARYFWKWYSKIVSWDAIIRFYGSLLGRHRPKDRQSSRLSQVQKVLNKAGLTEVDFDPKVKFFELTMMFFLLGEQKKWKRTGKNKNALKMKFNFCSCIKAFATRPYIKALIYFISRMPRIGKPTRQKWKYHDQPGKRCVNMMLLEFHCYFWRIMTCFIFMFMGQSFADFKN